MARLLVAIGFFPLMVFAQQQPSADSADRDFAVRAASAGMYEVQAANLALEKSKDDQVRSMARHLIEDHEKANDQLKRIAMQQGIQLPPKLLPEQQQLLDKLKSLSGKDFDKTYLSQQKQAHQQAIDLFQKEASAGQDPALKAFAQQTEPTLKMHLQMVTRGSTKM